jgi:ankyrin repeat protein
MLCKLLFALAAALPLLAQNSLATLIQTGNRKAALEKIRAGADVNEAQPDGTRPIHWAVFRVDPELVQALIAKKAVVEVANEFGSTPLAEAAKLGDAKIVKMLLDAGAKPNAANADDETAFMLAIKTGELPVVEMMLAAGANVNAIEKLRHQTALMYAAEAPKNAAEITNLLLAKDADVKVRALYNDWPSQITSEPRAQYRATGGLTALMYAARAGCYACVEAILRAGANVNTPTPEGVTPLMIAIDNEHNEVAKLLLDRGANPHVWDWWGRTALYIAVERKATLLQAARGRGGSGASDAPAAAVSSMQLIDTLLAADVNPSPELNMHRPSRGGNSGRFSESQLSTGCTPLFRAAQANDTEVMRALLAKGANPNINAMGFTPFLIVAGVGPGGRGNAPNTALLDLMLQNGADVNAQVTGTKTYSMRVSRAVSTNEGQSALHAAVQAGRAELVRYLLGKGIDAALLDANGKKAIDLISVAGAAGGTAATGGGPGRGGGAAAANAATATEIRLLLQDAASQK